MTSSYSLFPLGRVVATPNALSQIPAAEIQMALWRHAHGYWGDTCAEDSRTNEAALKDGGRIFSVYHAHDGTKFWIITEWDRSATTVLLPSDY